MLLHCMDGCFLMLVAVVYVVESRGAFFVFYLGLLCYMYRMQFNLGRNRVEQQQKQQRY